MLKFYVNLFIDKRNQIKKIIIIQDNHKIFK